MLMITGCFHCQVERSLGGTDYAVGPSVCNMDRAAVLTETVKLVNWKVSRFNRCCN